MLEADFRGSYCRVGRYADADEVNLVINHGSVVRTLRSSSWTRSVSSAIRDAEHAVISVLRRSRSAQTRRYPQGTLRRGGGALRATMLGRPGFFAAAGCAGPLHACADRAHRSRLPLSHHASTRASARCRSSPRRRARADAEGAAVLDPGSWRATREPAPCPALRGHARRPAWRRLAARTRRHPDHARLRRRAPRQGHGEDQAAFEGGLPAAPFRGAGHDTPSSQRARS